MKRSVQHLIKPAMLGTDDAKSLLQEAGIIALQQKAAYLPEETTAPVYNTIESYWLNSPYRRMGHPVRFAGKVVMQWFNNELGSFNLDEPAAIEFADDHIFRLLDIDESILG